MAGSAWTMESRHTVNGKDLANIGKFIKDGEVVGNDYWLYGEDESEKPILASYTERKDESPKVVNIYHLDNINPVHDPKEKVRLARILGVKV